MDGNQDRAPGVRLMQALLNWVGAGRELDDAGRVGSADARSLAALFATVGELYAEADSKKAMVRVGGVSMSVGCLLGWAQAASLLRHVNGLLEPSAESFEVLGDADALRTRLFNALFEQEFGINIAPESPSLVALNYERCIDTILSTLFIYQDAYPIDVSIVSEFVRMQLVPREFMEALPRSQSGQYSAAILHDVRIIVEYLDLLGIADLKNDLVEISDVGRVEVARRHGEPLPGDALWRIRVELLDL